MGQWFVVIIVIGVFCQWAQSSPITLGIVLFGVLILWAGGKIEGKPEKSDEIREIAGWLFIILGVLAAIFQAIRKLILNA